MPSASEIQAYLETLDFEQLAEDLYAWYQKEGSSYHHILQFLKSHLGISRVMAWKVHQILSALKIIEYEGDLSNHPIIQLSNYPIIQKGRDLSKQDPLVVDSDNAGTAKMFMSSAIHFYEH